MNDALDNAEDELIDALSRPMAPRAEIERLCRAYVAACEKARESAVTVESLPPVSIGEDV
jgi:hypothetical protein